MVSEIKVWQIENGNLISIETTMTESGRREKEDLEQWIKSDPTVLGGDILIIGEQVQTKSGPLDFLGIDRAGNILIIELKREHLPRVVLAQAVDYASDIANWDVIELNEECLKLHKQSLDTYIIENFDKVILEDIPINQTQRIILVGTYIEESLQRMIEWLSSKFQVSINAILFKYIKTKSGDELLARTVIIPEEIEKERSQKQQRKFEMSDEPGNYEDDELKALLKTYLSEDRATPRRIKTILIPLCLAYDTVKRDAIKTELIEKKEAKNDGQAGLILTTISRELGIKKRDYLRQIIRYDKINPWEKENYRIEIKYKDMITNILKG